MAAYVGGPVGAGLSWGSGVAVPPLFPYSNLKTSGKQG